LEEKDDEDGKEKEDAWKTRVTNPRKTSKFDYFSVAAVGSVHVDVES
jgi:hypothetical protein